jgi:hypothetical protein
MNMNIREPKKRTERNVRQKNKTTAQPDLLLALYEVVQGEREMVRVYSKVLQSDICLVNPERLNPETLALDCPVYTTRELAYIISLSPEEFQRFHYLKTRLVG